MKAVTYAAYGPPSVLAIREIDRPSPKPDELLVRVHAAEVTKGDCELRSFRFPVRWFALPLRLAWGIRSPRKQVLGGYFAGRIAAIGVDHPCASDTAMQPLKVGDDVFGTAGIRMATHAEFAVIPKDAVVARKPACMTFEEAAAVPLGGLNAIHFIDLAHLKPGQHILINGAGGSIGSFGVQLAKAAGAQVTAIDAPHKAGFLRDLGVDHFIDFTSQPIDAEGCSYDVVFDMVAGSSFGAMVRLLKPDGRYLTGNPTLLRMCRCVVTNWFSKKSASFAFAGERLPELIRLQEAIDAGAVRSVLDGVFSLGDAAAAHTRVESEARIGMVVLSMPDNLQEAGPQP